jgi:hypothetical protein
MASQTITFTHRGSFDKTEKFLQKAIKFDVKRYVESEAKRGVEALRNATPRDSGLASSSWGYEISQNGSGLTITWTNTDVENGFPVAVAIQVGYGTGTGGFVQGRDYINPAMKPVFDSIVERVWKAVTSA